MKRKVFVVMVKSIVDKTEVVSNASFFKPAVDEAEIKAALPSVSQKFKRADGSDLVVDQEISVNETDLLAFALRTFRTDSESDEGGARQASWEAACQIAGRYGTTLPLTQIDEMARASSPEAIDLIESGLFSYVMTSGSFPRRRRLWRFVAYRMVGITPPDVVEPT